MIRVNGQTHDMTEFSSHIESNGTISLQMLVETLTYKLDRIAVEYNGNIIKRADWATTIVKDNDSIEVVSFVGGC